MKNETKARGHNPLASISNWSLNNNNIINGASTKKVYADYSSHLPMAISAGTPFTQGEYQNTKPTMPTKNMPPSSNNGGAKANDQSPTDPAVSSANIAEVQKAMALYHQHQMQLQQQSILLPQQQQQMMVPQQQQQQQQPLFNMMNNGNYAWPNMQGGIQNGVPGMQYPSQQMQAGHAKAGSVKKSVTIKDDPTLAERVKEDDGTDSEEDAEETASTVDAWASLQLEKQVRQAWSMDSKDQTDAIVGYLMDGIENRAHYHVMQERIEKNLMVALGIDHERSYPPKRKSKPGAKSGIEIDFANMPWSKRRAHYRKYLAKQEYASIHPKKPAASKSQGSNGRRSTSRS